MTLAKKLNSDSSDIILAMIVSLRHLLGWIVSSFRSREDLVLENLLSVGNCSLCMRNGLALD
jgi:hypothetical protein